MHIIALLIGLSLLGLVLLDSFQTIILPRRPVVRFRLTRFFLVGTWLPWRFIVQRIRDPRKREQYYSFYGPLSLLMLFVFWAMVLVSAFGLIYFGLRAPFTDPWHPSSPVGQLRSCLYVSGSTLFTLGLGDVLPADHFSRLLVVLEAGTGLGFIALVIGYMPVLYTAFSARESTVALLDARAGSPPAAGELLARHQFEGGSEALGQLLAEWERWCAVMLETHISYPILCYYRSQHDNQSWLSALTAILDTCALVITAIECPAQRQAQLTFAVGRHVLVDIGHVFRVEAEEKRLREAPPVRLSDPEFARLCELLQESGVSVCADMDMHRRLDALRKLYEPQAEALAQFLRFELPAWVPRQRDPSKPDLWASVAQLRSPAGSGASLTQHVSPQATASHLGDEEGWL